MKITCWHIKGMLPAHCSICMRNPRPCLCTGDHAEDEPHRCAAHKHVGWEFEKGMDKRLLEAEDE